MPGVGALKAVTIAPELSIGAKMLASALNKVVVPRVLSEYPGIQAGLRRINFKPLERETLGRYNIGRGGTIEVDPSFRRFLLSPNMREAFPDRTLKHEMGHALDVGAGDGWFYTEGSLMPPRRIVELRQSLQNSPYRYGKDPVYQAPTLEQFATMFEHARNIPQPWMDFITMLDILAQQGIR